MVRAIVIAIFIIGLLMTSAAFYYASQVSDSKSVLDNYNARKEDLYLSQYRIEQTLSELNQTLQAEIERQKVLTDKVVELSAKADIPPPVINTTRTVQEPPIVITRPTPVTRAS